MVEVSSEEKNSIKVTEYVRNDARIKGNGKKEEPWEFIPYNYFDFKVSDPTRGKITRYGKCSEAQDEVRVTLPSDSKFEYWVTLCPNTGFKFESVSCAEIVTVEDNRIKMPIITKDEKCSIELSYITKKIELEFNANEMIEDAKPNQLFLVPKVKWAVNEDGEDKKTKLDAVPNKKGYSFSGYYLDKENEDKIIIDSKGIMQVVDENTIKDGKIYAHYKPKKYVVTYKTNGGEVNKENKKVTYDSNYGELEVPKKVGYIFQNWYSDESLKTKVESSTILKNDKDHDIYAEYKPITYKLKYDYDSGTKNEKEIFSVDYDKTFKVDNPKKQVKVKYSVGDTGATAGETSYKNLRSTEGEISFKALWSAPTFTTPSLTKTGYTCTWTSGSLDINQTKHIN